MEIIISKFLVQRIVNIGNGVEKGGNEASKILLICISCPAHSNISGFFYEGVNVRRGSGLKLIS